MCLPRPGELAVVEVLPVAGRAMPCDADVPNAMWKGAFSMCWSFE